MTCEECIHNEVCYRRDYVTSDFANKCGDYLSDGVFDDIKTLKHRSYLEGFHEAYQMYYKMFDDIKAEIPILSHWQTDDGQDLLMVADALECIDNHTGKEQSK